MPQDLKILFGILSVIPGVIAYTYYFRDLFAGRTKPHAFSWLIWGLLAGNGFIAQVGAGAGIGAWATGMTSVACLTIFAVALFRGETKATVLDKVLLGLALASFAMLFMIEDKTLSLCLTLFATLLGFAMTLRKAYWKPHEETAKSFALNALKVLPAIFALNSYTFLTVAYPLVAGLANAAVVLVLCVRRKQ
jgi:hypothetical protein